MNRYPLWKYVLIAVALVVGIVYTLPNFFAEVPAVQVSTSKANVKIDASTLQTVEDALKAPRPSPGGEPGSSNPISYLIPGGRWAGRELSWARKFAPSRLVHLPVICSGAHYSGWDIGRGT